MTSDPLTPPGGLLPGDPAQQLSGKAALGRERAFGVENRARLLAEYLDGCGPLTAAGAWAHIYRLLLWVDRTTGLAHCYESDKCQPGRPWYARSLAFHHWVSTALNVTDRDLGQHIDLLFRWAAADLARQATRGRAQMSAAAAQQRQPYAAHAMPQPGEDAELDAIVTETLRPYLAADPPAEALRSLAERIHAHVGQENKRKNLLGEGFEDTLAAVLRRIPGIADTHHIHVRQDLHNLPGFHRPRGSEKPRQVDLALVRHGDQHRTLVSCKWSVRSDREEQFASDFRAYAELEAHGRDFSYVLVTNEFDAARLAAACETRRQNALLFHYVVHVNTAGLTAAYTAPGLSRARRATSGQDRSEAHIRTGRLSSLSDWLTGLQD